MHNEMEAETIALRARLLSGIPVFKRQVEGFPLEELKGDCQNE